MTRRRRAQNPQTASLARLAYSARATITKVSEFTTSSWSEYEILRFTSLSRAFCRCVYVTRVCTGRKEGALCNGIVCRAYFIDY